MPKICPEIKKSPNLRAFLVHGANYRKRLYNVNRCKNAIKWGFYGVFLYAFFTNMPKNMPTE